MRLIEKVLAIGSDPIRNIEWVIAICTLLGGLYIFTPLYDLSIARVGMSPFAAALANPISIFLWGAVLLVGAGLVIFGLVKNEPRFKSAGWFTIMLARFFQILTTWLVVGFLPITWIHPFTVFAVILILWAKARRDIE